MTGFEDDSDDMTDFAPVSLAPISVAPISLAPISLAAHHPVQGRTILQELEQYWRDLRGARRIPVRSDVDPARIDSALPHAFILDRVAPGIGRLRVAGQKLSSFVGMDARGMPLTSFFSADARDMVMRQTELVFSRPALVEVPLLSHRSLGRPKLSGRMLLLPLLGPDGDVSRALGAILTDGMIGRSPRRFDIDPTHAIRCEELPEQTRQPMLAVQGLQEVARITRASPGHTRPALRLVVNNG